MGAADDRRWDRLVEEHREQERDRRAHERQRYEDARWRRHLLVTLGLVVGLTVAVAIGWYQLDVAVRRDPARCPGAGERAEVGLGGWAEPDTCTWFDADGQPIYRDGGTFAGPVVRSYGDVLHDNAVALSVSGGVVVAGSAVGLRWVLGRSGRR